MPGWSASVVASSAHRGFFLRGPLQPFVHDAAGVLESLLRERGKELDRDGCVAASLVGFLEYANRVAPVELVRFRQKDMGAAASRQHPFEHGCILLTQAAAAVDDQHQPD